MLQSLGVPLRVILLVCCDFLTLFACTFFVLCLRALWGDLNITSYDWMLSMLLLAPFMGLALGLYGVISLPAYVESTAKPSIIIPTALTSPNIKSERLLTTVMGSSSAAKALTAIIETIRQTMTMQVQTLKIFLAPEGMGSLFFLFLILFSPFRFCFLNNRT